MAWSSPFPPRCGFRNVSLAPEADAGKRTFCMKPLESTFSVLSTIVVVVACIGRESTVGFFVDALLGCDFQILNERRNLRREVSKERSELDTTNNVVFLHKAESANNVGLLQHAPKHGLSFLPALQYWESQQRAHRNTIGGTYGDWCWLKENTMLTAGNQTLKEVQCFF